MEAEGKTREEYEDSARQQMTSRSSELSDIEAFMQRNQLKTNDGGTLGARGQRKTRRTSAREPMIAGGAAKKRARSIAYAVQHRMGVEVHPVEGSGFDQAIDEWAQFTVSGAPRRNRDDEEIMLNPMDAVAAWKEYFRYIPEDSKWYGRV